MHPRPALTGLLALALPLAIGHCLTAPGPAQAMPEPLPWGPRGRSGAAYAELLRLLRDGDGALAPAALQKRDMHDFFVGLMGKRAAEPGRPAERGGGGPDPRCSTGPPEPAGASPPAA